MTDQLISFETAKLAKEKEFKEECTHYYVNKTEILKPFMFDDNPKVISIQDGTNNGLLTIAPTQSLLQKWLREEHKIFIEVGLNFNDKLNVAIYDRRHKTVIETIRHKIFLDASNNFNTYEEALEVGLQKALKLIP